jgi:hypothetical protein
MEVFNKNQKGDPKIRVAFLKNENPIHLKIENASVITEMKLLLLNESY